MARIGRKRFFGPRLTVYVTQEHITESEKKHSGHCMIAEATKDAAKREGLSPGYVAVDVSTVRFTDMKIRRRYTYLLPRKGQMALIRFDMGKHTEPFSMQLRNAVVTKAGGSREKVFDKATLVRTGGRAAVRQGGKTPPVMSLSKRRVFGIKAYTSQFDN